jgi:hypothetical protein
VNRRLAVSIAACVLLLAQYLLGMAVNVAVVLLAVRAPHGAVPGG